MENWEYVFCGIIAISVLFVIFCIVRGKGALHKRLVFFVSVMGIVAVIGFGGEAALNLFGIGWRCKLVNIMLMLCIVLYIIILCCCMGEFTHFKNANRALIVCGYISLSLAIFITLVSAFGYFTISSWWDGLTTYNDQTIVYATDQHGGSAAWRYYTHINDLVHGVEITQDGWHGTRLWEYTP